MTNEILNKRILKELENQHPLAGGQLAHILKANPGEVRDALDELMEAGEVAQSLDGFRYELAYGGYNPEPDPEAA